MRNHYLARFLAQRHQVWASFCGLSGDSYFCGEVPLRRPGILALFDPWFVWRAFRAIKALNIEAIVCSSLIAGLHGVLLKRLTGVSFWMDEHNVEWHCSRRYGFRAWPLVYLLEKFVVGQADFVTCVSVQDRERLIELGVRKERLTVAPNGVDFPALQSARALIPESSRGLRVLFFGVLDYPPNREAVKILAERIAPLLSADVEIVVAGRGGEDLATVYPRLSFVGFVEDIHALILGCDGVVVPILAGGGTRMKILESIACQRPVVSTACGAEGLDLELLQGALTVTDDYQAMADWVSALVIGGQVPVPEGFVELYDWETVWQKNSPL